MRWSAPKILTDAQLKTMDMSSAASRLAPRLKWHRWFAWRPVRVRNKIVWLEYVKRRLKIVGWMPPNAEVRRWSPKIRTEYRL